MYNEPEHQSSLSHPRTSLGLFGKHHGRQWSIRCCLYLNVEAVYKRGWADQKMEQPEVQWRKKNGGNKGCVCVLRSPTVLCHRAPFGWDGVFKVKSKWQTKQGSIFVTGSMLIFDSFKLKCYRHKSWTFLEDCWSVLAQQQLCLTYLHDEYTHKQCIHVVRMYESCTQMWPCRIYKSSVHNCQVVAWIFA